jgi:uncharacterized protein (UPF0332 family)
MSCTPPDLYTYAQSIASSANDEVSRRCAVNRLYYTAFHATKAFHNALASPGSVGNSKGSHEQLIAQLLNPTISKNNQKYAVSQALGKAMRGALGMRVSADYFLNGSVTKDQVEEILGLCQQVMVGVKPPAP